MAVRCGLLASAPPARTKLPRRCSRLLRNEFLDQECEAIILLRQPFVNHMPSLRQPVAALEAFRQPKLFELPDFAFDGRLHDPKAF